MTLGSQRCRAALLLAVAVVAITGSSADAANTVVKFETILGDLHIRLLNGAAPITTDNFLTYVNGGSYNDTVFHRLVRGFVLQGGKYGVNVMPNHGQITNEFGHSNVRGTLAMAKVGGNPDSATSEFFFNLDDNNDPDNPLSLDNQNGGFTVFAYVIDDGMYIVDALADTYQYSSFLIDTGDPNDPTDSRYAGEWPRIVVLDAEGNPQLDNEGNEIWHYEWINNVSVVGVDGDVDFDGDVDLDDYSGFVESFGLRGVGLAADFDGDYDVDLDDFAVFQANFGGPASPPAAPGGAVPEPAGICLLGLCGMATIAKRRRTS